ncbi:adenylate/guanylate cyclase domain-containing protein, partial [Candidatus Woesearchaeota archaeon]
MKNARRAYTISFLVVLFLGLLFFLGFFQTWQNAASDNLFTEKEPLEDIIIIAIDDHSLQEIGRWPWDRNTYVHIFEHLRDARVIGLDVAFFEPAPGDQELGALMRSLGTVVIPIEFDFSKNVTLTPAPGYENVTTGFVNIFTDDDGITRTLPLEYQGKKSFSLALYEKWRGKEVKAPQNPLRINYVGPPFTFKTISFADALKTNFTGKIVLIGATAPDLHDDALVPTSHGRAMPGVEIHANALQTLIMGQYLTQTPAFVTLLLMLLIAALITTALLRLPLIPASIITLAILIAYIFLSILFFDRGIILNIIYPTLTGVLVYVVLVAYFYVQEFIERQRVKNIFGKYVSPHLAEHILATTDKEDITLEGEERNIAVLFADIRGFTSMSEKMKPREVVSMLNTYLGAMTKSVFDNNGTLDKYMGDCIMALFGAPLPA